ncbi:PilZ domain-containing protein [Roseibium sp.]|uniref:PilZ domain-containing protein n=1 Tax=Roseibium sp. TaxID=1936156 RepID=UPI003D0F2236
MSNHIMAIDAKINAPALVVDLADMSCFEVSARDLTERGCWIVSDKVDLLKEEIGLRVEGFDRLIRGTVIAYGDKEAQISFEVAQDMPPEKRREIRRPVFITAIVCGKTSPVSERCRIVDASRSGCRLEGDRIDRLPSEIEISIPELDLPIDGTIVWRRDNHAGVKLNWSFESRPETQEPQQTGRGEDGVAKPARKIRISAFGR